MTFFHRLKQQEHLFPNQLISEHLLLELFLENLIILISDHNLEHMMDLQVLILHEKYAKYFYHVSNYYQQRKVN